ncbi:MAG TPA: DUF790 family protein [Candidatus Nitrosocosmicus sp.]|nr:DUF790 family protein [Candidatus Nitrosocosmicus sp.]
MIPSDILRYKLDNKNNRILPVLCSLDKNSKDLEIATQIIQAFEYCFRNKEIKENLDQLLKNIEYVYKDFKLVRGLSTILERRCTFSSHIHRNLTEVKHPTENGYNDLYDNRNLFENFSAPEIRKAVFAESSMLGIATDKNKRETILQNVSNRLGIKVSSLLEIMWSDLEGNSIIRSLNPVTPAQLLYMYNISSVQTLLFGCIQMKVWLQSNLSEGTIWKEILRDVKRLGLMYWLDSLDYGNENESDNNDKRSQSNPKMICTIEGALNVLKLTDRYGNAISKLFPYILKSQKWNISCDILKNSINGKKSIYKFEIAYDTYPGFIPTLGIQNQNILNTLYVNRTATDLSFSSEKDLSISQASYDSKIEKIFSEQFELMRSGWKIEREPGPIITTHKAAFIPDFVLSKYDIKILVEIVGFWTKEYLERKLLKLNDIIQNKKYSNEYFFMILVINYANLMSYEMSENENFIGIKNMNDSNNQNILLTSYKQNRISFKDIISYLKAIEERYLKHQFLNESNQENLMIKFANSLKDLSNTERSLILFDELEKIIKTDRQVNTFEKIRLSDLFNKNPHFSNLIKEEISRQGLILIKECIFKKRILDEIFNEIKEISTLGKAIDLLKSKEIPEKIHIDLLNFLGFQIDWAGLDYSKAKLVVTKDSNNLNHSFHKKDDS